MVCSRGSLHGLFSLIGLFVLLEKKGEIGVKYINCALKCQPLLVGALYMILDFKLQSFGASLTQASFIPVDLRTTYLPISLISNFHYDLGSIISHIIQT